MTRLLLSALALAAVYLLVLTSLAPGDVATALVIGLVVALGMRAGRPDAGGGGLHLRARAVPGLIWETALEMARGTWRVVRFCLERQSASGLVEIPREGRSDADAALWGLITGEAPDEIVVDVDDERDVLVVHLTDASDPEAIRARHRAAYARWRGEGR